MNKTVTFILHLLCGVLLALALPPLALLWLGVVGLIGLQFLNADLHRLSPASVFLRGLGFGLGYFGFALHWIGFAFLVDADAYLWMMPFAVGGLALFMALFWAVAFLFAARLIRFGLVAWVALPSTLGTAEFLRGYLFTGFPWAAPGLVADGMGPVLQVASVIGMPGLSVMVLLWGMAIAAVLQKRLLAILVLATLPAVFFWGQWRLTTAETTASGPLIRLVQPNISQSDKWRDENTAEIFADLLELSSQKTAEVPKVVIWPESAVSFLLDENAEALSRIADVLEHGQVLLAGSLRRSETTVGGENYFTSIHMIDDQGVVQESYDKWRLVPGGEYLPFAWALEPLGFRKVVDLPESFTPGEGPRSIDVPGVGLAGMLICYEAIFPHDLVDAKNRPRWIVNVTNDGWFGKSVGPYQHLAQVRMRAVEQGLPIARAANTGISALIDPWGRITASADLETRGMVDVRLPAALEPTVFARWGLLIFCAIFMLALACIVTIGRKAIYIE
jgi:apolipoprotein N-acyltransferase